MIDLEEMGLRARGAARVIARASSQEKNAILDCIATGLNTNADEILAQNAIDCDRGEKSGLSPALLDRLLLTPERLEGMAGDLRKVIDLPDPVGEIFDRRELPNGLHLYKQRVPIGVLAVIYEARPNVTIDIAGLAIKTGNAVILRGGSETIHTNQALVDVIHKALVECGFPQEIVQFIDDPDRALVGQLLRMHRYVDMLIPRGGAALHDFCRENSSIPVITGGIGICHLFVDESADLEAALEVIVNAKMQRPSVCNALDTVLVHRRIAAHFLPLLVSHLGERGVEIRAHESAISYLKRDDRDLSVCVQLAGAHDFDTEWLSLILGVKVVDGLQAAVEHISQHSTGHSDGILTNNEENASRFVAEVDSAAVYVNASTRFTDGGQLGLGAEVAISTQRLHARGPMGLRELTTYKWVIRGDYHVRK